MYMKTVWFCILLFFSLPLFSETDEDGGISVILGEVEMVFIDPPGRWMRARMDTGAALSSLNAYDITEVEKDGSLWVCFNMANALDTEDIILELPVERVVAVRQGNRSEIQNRYIVLLDTVLGELELKGEFSLADRRSMTYPVLIGRNLLSGNALVDVSRQYIQE